MTTPLKRCAVLAAALAGAGLLAAPATAATTVNHNPFGHLDTVTSPAAKQVHVNGWALDPDAPKQRLYVAAYVDGKYQKLFREDTARPDVAKKFHSGPDQGYTFNLTTTPGRHTICILAGNTGPGHNAYTGCLNVKVT